MKMPKEVESEINKLFEDAVANVIDGNFVNFADWFWNAGFRVVPRVDKEWQNQTNIRSARLSLARNASAEAAEAMKGVVKAPPGGSEEFKARNNSE